MVTLESNIALSHKNSHSTLYQQKTGYLVWSLYWTCERWTQFIFTKDDSYQCYNRYIYL